MRIVRQVTGKPIEIGGEEHIGWLPANATEPLPTELEHEIVDVRILETDGGFILEWESRNADHANDSWHETVEDAEHQAELQFGITATEWQTPREDSTREFQLTGGSGPNVAYSDHHIAAYPVEYIAGIDLYNAGEFHAAHDVWEERWMGEVGPQEKLFLQAMIQSAVAFHHLEIGRPGAARRMHQMAKEKFARLGHKVFMSLDLVEYQKELERALSWLWDADDPRELTKPEIIPPKIRLLSEVTNFD